MGRSRSADGADRDVSFNSYGVLNVRDEFAKQYPAYVKRVLAAYEKARLWAIQNPAEFRALYGRTAKINDAVVDKVLGRTNLSNPVLGDEQKKVIAASGDVTEEERRNQRNHGCKCDGRCPARSAICTRSSRE
jgi:sulfonate transport system substrate-binding protein